MGASGRGWSAPLGGVMSSGMRGSVPQPTDLCQEPDFAANGEAEASVVERGARLRRTATGPTRPMGERYAFLPQSGSTTAAPTLSLGAIAELEVGLRAAPVVPAASAVSVAAASLPLPTVGV